MAVILNFWQKIPKHKNAYISKTMLDRAISTKFLTHGVSLQSGHPNFKKNSTHPKCRPFSIFEILAEIAKHKNAYISKTVLDRVISTKFLSGHPNFSKKKVSPIMAAILNSRIFRKNCKTQKCLYLENRAR